MPKIIRERYEGGVLISREIEGSNVNLIDLAKLGAHLVIALSVALIAALSVMDTFGYSGADDQSEISVSDCRPTLRS